MIETMIKIALGLFFTVITLRCSNFLFKAAIKKNNRLHFRFFNSMVDVLIICVVGFILLQQFDATKQTGKTLLQSGTLIVAILVFAAQQTLTNVIGGLLISLTKPFEVGQKIKVTNTDKVIVEGIVEDINLRHTIIKQYDGQRCLVPNSIINSSVITNTNYKENVGNFFEFNICYGNDVEKAMELLKAVICNDELSVNDVDRTQIFVKELCDKWMVLKTTVWTGDIDDNFALCSKLRVCLIKIFEENGITTPYINN